MIALKFFLEGSLKNEQIKIYASPINIGAATSMMWMLGVASAGIHILLTTGIDGYAASGLVHESRYASPSDISFAFIEAFTKRGIACIFLPLMVLDYRKTTGCFAARRRNNMNESPGSVINKRRRRSVFLKDVSLNHQTGASAVRLAKSVPPHRRFKHEPQLRKTRPRSMSHD
jgi:hypothetical protein